MIRHALAAITLALLGSFACNSTGTSSGPRSYTLVFLKTGPNSGKLPDAEKREAFAGHFANMGRMAEQHKLVLAGPFGETRHDPALRGLFVINSGTRAEAMKWAASDPTTQAGVFVQEFHDFATDAPLQQAIERELELSRKATAEGRTRPPGEGARSYVLLTAEQGNLARRELMALNKGGGVFLVADLEGGRTLAVLDAANVAEARQRFERLLDAVGPHTLDDWFATGQLAQMGDF